MLPILGYGLSKWLNSSVNDCAFDAPKYSDRIAYDKRSFIIHGRRIFLRSGEFHYWRLPDQNRWRHILLQYKSAGLNAVRIYFHWGYHSPREGVYNFSGNRDVEYLLRLCEEIGLYVIAAPGPYICSETSGGGMPTWLIQKTEVRIRHMYTRLVKQYDERYIQHGCDWLREIFSIFVRHQITGEVPGCLIALQLENELFLEGVFSFGYELSALAECARRCGMTVPLFHNDCKDLGSFVPGKGSHKMDLYSFDRYVQIPPVSKAIHDGWNAKQLINEIKGTEKRVRGFGDKGPIFIAELQGGWFRGWECTHDCDAMYDYFGSKFTPIVLDLFTSEGMSAYNLYMFYGGTNWGALGDPDVMTSYDYSSPIRENGFLSERYRRVRHSNMFLESWTSLLALSDQVSTLANGVSVVFNTRRAPDGTRFLFFANLKHPKESKFRLIKNGVDVKFDLPFKESFVAVEDLKLTPSITLQLSTMFLIVKGRIGNTIVFVGPHNNGSLLFSFNPQKSKLFSNAQVSVAKKSTEVHFSHPGYCVLESIDGSEPNVLFVCLEKEEALSLNADFDYTHSDVAPPPPSTFQDWLLRHNTVRIVWGPYNATFAGESLVVEASKPGEKLHVLQGFCPPGDFESVSLPSFFASDTAADFKSLPIFSKIFSGALPPSPHTFAGEIGGSERGERGERERARTQLELGPWSRASLGQNWDTADWHPLAVPYSPNSTALVHGYTSGHVAYRCRFFFDGEISDESASLTINLRHFGVIWVNGHCVGHQLSYANTWKNVERSIAYSVLQGVIPLASGNSNGVDSENIGGKTYNISQFLKEGNNVIIILIDNFGMCRQALFNNDIRNARGLILGALNGPNVKNIYWEIAGTNVTAENDPFNISGLPFEKHFALSTQETYIRTPPLLSPSPQPSFLDPADGLVWYQTTFISTPFFDGDKSRDSVLFEPLRILISGNMSCVIWVNKILIARYHGLVGPQTSFPIPHGLLQSHNTMTVAAYTSTATLMSVSLRTLPLSLDNSGNINEEEGIPFSSVSFPVHLGQALHL